MRYYKDNNGKKEWYKGSITLDGRKIYNPSEEKIIEAGYIKYEPTPVVAETYTPTYEEKVRELIHERYSIDDELAILRQRDSKPEEFAAYDAFCEACKAKAKAIGN